MSSSNSNPQTTNTTAQYDERVGVDGANNRVLQGGATDLGGGIFGGSGPVAAQTFDDTGEVFAPIFNFAGSTPAPAPSYPQNNYGGYYDPYDPLNANYSEDDRWYALATPQPAPYIPPASPTVSIPVTNPTPSGGGNSGNFGGAVQGSGVITGGSINAPVASGDDSIAQQVSGGGVAVAGDNEGPIVTAPIAGPGIIASGDVEVNAPIITAPVSGPVTSAGGDIDAPVVNAPAGDGGVSAPITAGGDVEIGGNVFAGNTAPITITSDAPEVFKTALESNNAATAKALSFANDSLRAVAESVKDPSERLGTSALWTVGLVAAAIFALPSLLKSKAA